MRVVCPSDQLLGDAFLDLRLNDLFDVPVLSIDFDKVAAVFTSGYQMAGHPASLPADVVPRVVVDDLSSDDSLDPEMLSCASVAIRKLGKSGRCCAEAKRLVGLQAGRVQPWISVTRRNQARIVNC